MSVPESRNRTKLVAFRVREDSHTRVHHAAEAAGVTMSELVQELLHSVRPDLFDPPAEPAENPGRFRRTRLAS